MCAPQPKSHPAYWVLQRFPSNNHYHFLCCIKEVEARDLYGVKYYIVCVVLFVICSYNERRIYVIPNIAGYDMSPFIRRYAKYLSEKSAAYRGTAMDFCKVKRGSVIMKKDCKVTNVTILLQKGRGRAQTDEWRQAPQDDADITEPGGRLAGVRLQRHSKYSDGDWGQLEH